jgi:retron-type reverse transcriptase
LGIAALEDKIVQQAVVTILNQIYEVDFKGFSYGFRPGRSPHQALDALTMGIHTIDEPDEQRGAIFGSSKEKEARNAHWGVSRSV